MSLRIAHAKPSARPSFSASSKAASVLPRCSAGRQLLRPVRSVVTSQALAASVSGSGALARGRADTACRQNGYYVASCADGRKPVAATSLSSVCTTVHALQKKAVAKSTVCKAVADKTSTPDNDLDFRGTLPAEFGNHALKLLRRAAYEASAVAADASSAKRPNSTATKPASDEPTAVLVTERHLLAALLQEHPEAAQLLPGHITVLNQQPEPAARQQAGDEVPKEHSWVAGMQLSPGLLQAIYYAVKVTRLHGRSTVRWPSLLSGLMRVPNSREVYGQVSGSRLAAEGLQEHMQQQLSASSDSSRDRQLPVSSWMDQTLQLALEDSNKQHGVDAVRKAAGAVNAAAAARYQPSSAWLSKAWSILKAAFYVRWPPRVTEEVVAAAYNSITHLQYTEDDVFYTFQQVVSDVRGVNDTWLQALVVASAHPNGREYEYMMEQLIVEPEGGWDKAIRNQYFLPPADLLVYAIPAMLGCRGAFWGLDARLTVARALGNKACDVFMRTSKTLALQDMCQLIRGVSALRDDPTLSCRNGSGCWEQVLHLIVTRACSKVEHSSCSADLLTVYAAVFSSSNPAPEHQYQVLQLLWKHVQLRKLPDSLPWLQGTYKALETLPQPAMKQAPNRTKDRSARPAHALVEALALAADAVGSMSMQEVSALLQAIAANKADPTAGHLLQQEVLPPGLDADVLLPLVVSALAPSTAVRSTTQDYSNMSRPFAGAVADLLYSAGQIPVYFPPDMMQHIMTMMPQLQHRLNPEQLKQVVGFLNIQQRRQTPAAKAVLLSSRMTAELLQLDAPESNTLAQSGVEAYRAAYADVKSIAAGKAAAILKAMQDNPAAQLSAQQLVDIAQALGASKLSVEPAVMDVLAYHVGRMIDVFTASQVPVLLWAFALKWPSPSRSKHVIMRLMKCSENFIKSGAYSTPDGKELDVLRGANLLLAKAGCLN